MAENFQFPVDRSAILAFAAALGETNPIYFDERHCRGAPIGGVLAPPTFPAAANHWDPDYYLRGVRRIPPPTSGAAARLEAERLARLLHAEMHFEYFAPLVAGMELTVSAHPGRRWEKTGRRGGALKFEEIIIEYRDTDGALLARGRSVSVLLEDRPEQPA